MQKELGTKYLVGLAGSVATVWAFSLAH